MNDIINESIKVKRMNGIRINKDYLYFKWINLLFVIPLFLVVSDCPLFSTGFWLTFIAALTYNIFLTVMVSMKRPRCIKKIINLMFYLDIFFICAFSLFLGGIDSDIYIILIFTIAYFGINKDVTAIVNISIFTIALYSFTIIVSQAYALEQINFLKLTLRDLYILLASYGVAVVVMQVKKYDEMHKREFKLARTDKLTGLANRHCLDQKLEEEALYSEYSKMPLNVLMFDLDNFKKFNDTYGHVWGDKLLSIFGEIIMQSIRKTDIPIRYGGEEFMILIRDLDLEKAKSIGDRIRRQLENQKILTGEGKEKVKITVSCGVAQFPRHSDDIKKVVDYADQALYYAKEIGKNIVVSYDEIGKLREAVQIDIDSYLRN
ncbi:MAG TPA: GGDEF domain-containing protein [Acetivibrio sp.]|nr:GGDEF domain-containing protein [Acetivibrio sp.]HPT92042.1 GGDEF domain-containing protein [Acetivibrio sp.]HQA56469.1 GGDEF domain-containing protein [Acetivibrio sp.]